MKKLSTDTLIEMLEKIDENSKEETLKSLNHLPEYYLNVKLSDHLYEDGYGFEIEKPTREVARELDIETLGDDKFIDEVMRKRIRNGRVDLVVMTKEKRSIRHIIELKIGAGEADAKFDVDRLVWFSRFSKKKSMLRSFYIFSTSKGRETVHNTIERIENSFMDDSYNDNVTLKYDSFLSGKASTREKSEGKEVSIVVLEIKVEPSQ